MNNVAHLSSEFCRHRPPTHHNPQAGRRGTYRTMLCHNTDSPEAGPSRYMYIYTTVKLHTGSLSLSGQETMPHDICAVLWQHLENHSIRVEGDFELWQCDNPGAVLLHRQSKPGVIQTKKIVG